MTGKNTALLLWMAHMLRTRHVVSWHLPQNRDSPIPEKKKFAPILQNKFRCPGKVVDFKIQNDFNGLGSKRAWDEVVVEFVII
jgi:hypothetical protein